jgi:class 3 adenylate cyclase
MAKDAFIMVFDLEGFSSFCGQPDVQDYVAKYLNRVFEVVAIAIGGGTAYWNPRPEKLTPFVQPVHAKFLGDGALYIWTFNRSDREKVKDAILHFINRMWNIKVCFPNVVARCAEEVPVVDIPRRIRVGFASGSVCRIRYKHTSESEFVGYCINLASRLQSYCRDLGFIASARIAFPKEALARHNYMKVVAKKLEGFPREIVIVDRKEFASLSEEVRDDLFELL